MDYWASTSGYRVSESRQGGSTSDAGYGFVVLDEDDFCYLDDQTIKTLELIENNMDSSNKRHSLMGLLSFYTSTTTGFKLLNEAIKKPLCHLATLEHRLDCIEYLSKRVDTLSMIGASIKRYGQSIDLNNVIPALINLVKIKSDTISMAEKRLDAISTIEVLVSQVEYLVAALQGADQETLNIYKVALDDPAYGEILSEIYNFIEPESKLMRGKKCKIMRIKNGVESLFDIARSTYLAALDDMEQYVRELHRDDGYGWKLSYGTSRGYYLSMGADRIPKGFVLPPKYIRINKTTSAITCTTRELMQCNVRANVSYDNSMKLANEILVTVISSIIQHLDALLKLIDIVGMLDLVTALAKVVHNSNGSMVRPKFTATETVLTGARHPILESVNKANNLPVIPNDIRFSVRDNNFMLITGPNMGGKSIFLKQVALIQILAQIGSYVPAESAHIKLMNRIVVRSGTNNDSNSNCSSFMWEMKGIASALLDDMNNPHKSIMYIIDEVGRGTSVDHGASYSFAIAEELAFKRNCFTVFATHFDQIFCLTSLYRNITAYHFKYGEDTNNDGITQLKITHKLIPGIGDKIHYGIKLAKAFGFPDEILELAYKDISL